MTRLDGISALAAPEHHLAVVSTVRADATIRASVVNAGVLPHPVTEQQVVAFGTYGSDKLSDLRARPQVTLTLGTVGGGRRSRAAPSWSGRTTRHRGRQGRGGDPMPSRLRHPRDPPEAADPARWRLGKGPAIVPRVGAEASWLDSMPDVYDQQLGPALFAPFAADMATRVAELEPARVLEIAAGTGIVTRALLAAVPAAQIVATDLNDAMVTWAAQRAPGAQWRRADAQALPLPDAAFDVVVCQFGVMFFPDKPAAFAEAARVLAPGGTLLFSVWDAVERSLFPAVLTESLAAVVPRRTPDFVARIPHGYVDRNRIAADLAAGGLIPRRIETVRLHGSAPSARALAEGFCLGTPLRFELAERGSLEQLRSAVAEQMVARLGAGPVRGDLTALVVTAQHRP